jgi:hypothetical protein
MALKDWKMQKVDSFRTLWTKGKFRPGKGYKDHIHLDKQGKMDLQLFPNDKYEVGAKRKINPKTINGHFKQFKNKSSALRVVKAYLIKY